MLERNREQAPGGYFDLFAPAVKPAHHDFFVPRYIGKIFRHAEAAFLERYLASSAYQLGIYEHDQPVFGFLALNIYYQHTERAAHLVCRKTDSRRVIHRLDHVVYETLNAVVDIFDAFGLLAQYRVRIYTDGKKRHLNISFNSSWTLHEGRQP